MEQTKLHFTSCLEDNIQILNDLFAGDHTFICREVRSGTGLRCALFFFDGMVNNEVINQSIVRPITLWDKGSVPIDRLVAEVIQINDCPVAPGTDKLLGAFLYGDTIVFVDGDARPAVVNTKGFPRRSPEEPDNEKVLRGPREGFAEAFMGNLALIRRRLRTPMLKFTFFQLGTVTHTNLVLCYLDGIADKQVLGELKRRLRNIPLDSILDANYIAEYIQDNRYSPFPTVGMTERPDIVAAKLLEGRVALVVDGTPVVLTLPQILQETFQTNDDYYVSYLYMNLSRLLRVLGFFLTVTIPGMYLAMIVYHPEMIPTKLLYSIAAARAGIPFSTLTEAIGMILVFEILKEAGTRTPNTVGQALSIVGGLVLGQAAVEARLVSAPMVIVVAFSGVTALIVPKLRTPALLLRFVLLACAAVFGIYGILLGWAGIFAHLCRLQSMGVPYIRNLVTRDKQSGRDVLLRFPWFAMKPSHRFLAGKKGK